MTPTRWRRTSVVFLAALALFLPSAFNFNPGVVDLGAVRVLHGELPYRDFWTMYAPGSFFVVAAAFSVFGVQLLVANLLGAVTAAAGVALFYRLVDRTFGGLPAVFAASLFAVAYRVSGYQDAFSSYPPVILLIWMAWGPLTFHVDAGGRGRLALAGACLGLAALFKHDVAGYAALASAGALLLMKRQDGEGRLASLGWVGGTAMAVAAAGVVPLAVLAPRELFQDLVVFPLTDFPKVRQEDPLELYPSLEGASRAEMARGLALWGRLSVPYLLTLAALPALWLSRRRLTPAQRRLALMTVLAFPIYWSASRVQLNTHIVTLTGLATMLFSAAFLRTGSWRVRTALAGPIAVAWATLLMTPPLLDAYYPDGPEERESLNLPRLGGLRATQQEARSSRGLAAAMTSIAPPEVPILLLGNRNDVLLHAGTAPYWFTDRQPVTRHHELHPAVTDTEPVQRQMLEDLVGAHLPVLVREYRFSVGTLERIKAEHLGRGVPVGARLLDEWVAANYRPCARFGIYELMQPRTQDARTSDASQRVCVQRDSAAQ